MQTLEQLKSGQLKGATQLKLSCGLTQFPKEIFELADTLELLDLSFNSISQLPDDFGRLTKLKIAFFSDNQFIELPKVLSDCPVLEMIGFKSNKIASVSDKSIPATTRWLILTNNQIPEIPVSIGKCERLQKVAFAGNKLKTLPVEMANCKNLELLRISANHFDELPQWLLQLPKLSWLAFSGNSFNSNQTIHDSFYTYAWKELELKEKLGEGASGIISRAVLTDYGHVKDVAVKVFKGEVTSDGLPHDEMLACIEAGNHEHIVNAIGKISGHPEGKEGLLFELIPPDFKNLGMPPSFVTCTRDVFKDDLKFTIDEILKIAFGIASASDHLHSNGIMHGDLYAHNIMVNSKAYALFGDFGAATIYDRNSDIAAQLERLDVRAYGCLLDDLLARVIEEDKKKEITLTLQILQRQCTAENIAMRPDFKKILSYF